MFDPMELVRSVEHVWVVWLLSLCALIVIFWQALKRIKFFHAAARVAVRHLLRDEAGNAYSLSYILALPTLIMLILLFTEATLILMAKTGTVYAAFAGARSATVHYSPANPSAAQTQARRAAMQAMVPFSCGLLPADRRGTPSVFERRYLDAYKKVTSSPGTEQYLLAKLRYANRPEMMQVSVTEPANWFDDIDCTVNYHYRYTIPLIGKLLGSSQDSQGDFFAITTVVSLQSEAPQNESKSMGIKYATPQ